MSLKKKLILILIVLGCILILLFQSAFHLTMQPSLEDQKIIFIEKLKKKIGLALSIEEKNIAILCTNWADWENMASYVEKPSKEFEADVFPDVIFSEDMMDVILVVSLADGEKNILFYKGYEDKRFLSLEEMNISGEIDKIKERLKKSPRVLTSIIKSGYGPVMLVSSPITTNGELGKTSGLLILGRFIDQKMLKKISSYIMEPVRTLPFNEEQLHDFYTRRMQGKKLFYKNNKEKLTVYHLLKDINDRPAVILYTKSDNKLFRVVNQHAITFIIISLLSIIFFGLLLYFSIEKQIIKRMLNISGTMSKIEGLADLSKRIDNDKKNDEISYLIANINSMLDKLENEKKNRENAEKTMITQEKLVSIGRLASCMSHEINNPLLAISNSVQVIKKINKNKSPLFKDAIEISESEINRIRDIISSLLDFHRFEKEEFSHLDVKEIVLKSLGILKWSKKLGSTEIIRKMNGDCFIYASPVKLEQVFINFILNAVEAMENRSKKGKLQIEVKHGKKERGKNFAEIHFLDNGPGMPEEVKNHLFEPFVSTKKIKGVGLGLYICYKIIDHHHGEIIYNDAYRKGTHFIIKLPMDKRAGNE